MINNTTIILTSTVNVNLAKSYIFQKNRETRLETYKKSILQWLNKTSFNIVLVENSGYTFDELNNEKEMYKDRFEVITFKESELQEANYLKNDSSKGSSEMFAIDYAFRHSNIARFSNFIIKVTCRFFIPELEEYLANFDLSKYDCLTQNERERCEMVGSSCENFEYIFNIECSNQHIEHLWLKRTSFCENILVCKNFKIEKTQRGGLDEFFETI